MGTVEALKAFIIGSPEYFQNRAGGTNDGFLTAVYHDILGRGVDPFGRQVFGSALVGGEPRSAVAAAIVLSTEAEQDLIQSMYKQFLRRPADGFGLNAFLNAFHNGMSDEQAIAAFVGSDEYFGRV